MGTRSEYMPGTFCWVDLSTSDPDGAKGFYAGLFGWEFEDSPAPGTEGTYSVCTLGDDAVGAITRQGDRVPVRWNSYVSVASADEVAAKAAELGATVIEQPVDVGEAGRMAVFQDPAGTALCLWQPGEMIGAARVNDPGCLTWNELHTPEPAAALEFYSALFGWGRERMDTPEGAPSYTVVKVGERTNGAVMDAQPGEPPNWLPYFTVENRDSAAERASGLGARELFRLEVPAGMAAGFADPQGAAFAVFEGEIDD